MIGINYTSTIALTSVLILIVCASEIAGQRAHHQAYGRMNFRRARNDNGITPEQLNQLKSSNVDPRMINSIGSAQLGDRRRRDKDTDLHAKRVKTDAIAAAAESAAAEADSVAAAVEASEIGSPHHNGRVASHFTNDVDEKSYDNDSDNTVDNGEDGDNGVEDENETREGEHNTGTIGEFDIQDAVDSRSGYSAKTGGGGKTADGTTGGKMVEDDQGLADVKQPLSALLFESSDLAKQIRMIFQVLARREDYLVREMEKLKNALTKAIHVLEENNRVLRKRRDN